jgi:MFS transporter, ACS family, D-galactonate transporter
MMTKGAIEIPEPVVPREEPHATLWRRQLAHYPTNGPRALYLAIVVVVTIQLYYELYVGGAVAPQIIAQFNFTLTNFVAISIIGNAVGALASVGAGLADRWGRANIVVVGLLLTVLLILFGIPNAHTKIQYVLIVVAISLVEGMVLVATPALIRDFSPQLGRASAMGFWTLGPVIGSLVVSTISSHTLASHPDWRFQFRLCGVVGLVIFAVAFIGLRELSPRLRDQIMVSLRDRTLVEARAAGIDEKALLRGTWRQMLKKDVVGPAFAISVFLLFYYVLVGFFVIYYVLTFNYTEARANALANWYWAANAVALVIIGVVSDKLRVRKPFMVGGTLVSAAGVAVFAVLTTDQAVGYYTYATLLVVIAAGGGVAYCAWMAAFTETVERHNPAGVATGLAVWGGILRGVVCVSLIGLVVAVPSAAVLVDHGTQVQTLSTKYAAQLDTLGHLSASTKANLAGGSPAVQAQAVSELSGVPVADVATISAASTQYAAQLATIAAVDPATLAALGANPNDPVAGPTAVGQIMAKLGVDQATAITRLRDINQVPKATLATLQASGAKVSAAAAKLTAVGKVPAADLAYLGQHGPEVVKAQGDSKHEWQRWWWVCFAAQLVFLPFVFLLGGRWSPRKAAEDARAHAEAVDRELAALASGTSAKA